MLVEIASRLLAMIAAVGFTLVLARGRLPGIPTGRWTVVALFAVGIGMCTVAGIRDDIGQSLILPAWLTTVLATLGGSAMVALLAVLVGLSWRVGVLVLAAAIGGSWLLAFGYAFYAGLDTVASGAVTLIAPAAASLFVWRMPAGSLSHTAPAVS